MRDYFHRWDGQPTHIPTTEVPTPIIHAMIETIEREPGRVECDGAEEDLVAVLERLRLELQIRAWGLS